MKIVATVLQVAGGVILLITLCRMVFIGKAHHGRSGAPSLTPSLRPMAPDLMAKMDVALKRGVLGGGLLAAGWAIGKWFGG